MNLDLRDWRLLYELEKNARSPLTQFAKNMGISKQLCRYKLDRMEQAGIIKGYHAIIDTTRLGYTTYRVYLRFQHLAAQRREEMFTFLASVSATVVVNSLDGYWDVGIAIMVQDIYDFYGVWETIMQRREFIAEYNVTIYSPIYHFTRTFLDPGMHDVPRTFVLGGRESVAHDAHDLQILHNLAPNIRKPLTQIATAIGKSTQFVINRIKNMEKNGIIQGYRPILNWELLGFNYYKVDIVLRSYGRNEEILAFCQQHPFIFQVDKTIGGSDFEVEIYAKSKEHFKEIVQEIQSRFIDVFVNFTYFIAQDVYKETYFPTETRDLSRWASTH